MPVSVCDDEVGWIFAHPAREEGFIFSGNEIMTAAVEQLEAAQGVKETPFATVRVSLAVEEGETVVHVDAFQVWACLRDGPLSTAASGPPKARYHDVEGSAVTRGCGWGGQVSKQCMEMVAEGAVSESEEPGSMQVAESYTAIVEGKSAKKVDNNFYIVNVPIGNHEAETFVTKFPRVRL